MLKSKANGWEATGKVTMRFSAAAICFLLYIGADAFAPQNYRPLSLQELKSTTEAVSWKAQTEDLALEVGEVLNEVLETKTSTLMGHSMGSLEAKDFEEATWLMNAWAKTGCPTGAVAAANILRRLEEEASSGNEEVKLSITHYAVVRCPFTLLVCGRYLGSQQRCTSIFRLSTRGPNRNMTDAANGHRRLSSALIGSVSKIQSLFPIE